MTAQAELFATPTAPEGTSVINGRCVVRTGDGHRVVLVAGMPIAQYSVGDRMAEAHAMVLLVEQGWAEQGDVARAFGATARTVRRHQRRFEDGGLVALGRKVGFPSGRPRVTGARAQLVSRLKADGQSNREIARRVGVSEAAIRKLLRRLGWRPPQAEQQVLALPANPNLSASEAPAVGTPAVSAAPAANPNLSAPVALVVDTAAVLAALAANPNLSAPAAPAVEAIAVSTALAANPNLSAPAASAVDTAAGSAASAANPNLSALPGDEIPISADVDPADRRVDRLLAYLGLLNDAVPLFRDGQRVPRAGVLLAIPALLGTGLLDEARAVYGSIGPAFYGLRTTLVALVVMALLRIKRPEALKEHSPEDLGRVLGLDRAPEVKTLRRKLARLAAASRATELGRRLAERRVASRGDAMGFLYIDGHVRVYHGQREIPQTHVARMRLSMPSTSDYWVNDAAGEPLFVVTAEANAGLVKMLPPLLKTIRDLVGEKRVTVVFDRGGWSPKLFLTMIASGFDVLTYRKGRVRRVPRTRFTEHVAILDDKQVKYMLADQGIALLRGKLRMRQVTRLSEDGTHQTPIVTSRRDLPTVEIAYRMFDRWRQENFFKYLREEYALDALTDYAVEPDDPAREVPNPKWAAVDAEWQAIRKHIVEIAQRVGVEATIDAIRGARHTKLDEATHAELGDVLMKAMRLERRRDRIPRRIPVSERTQGPVIKLATERKHLTNVLKMVAYQAESDLVRAVAPHYHRADDEGRTLVQTALAAPADIQIKDGVLQVILAPLSSAHRDRAIAAVCEQLNAANVCFPGTRLRLRYAVASDVMPDVDRTN
jgi:transposase